MEIKNLFFSLLLMGALGGVLPARTIKVPGDYATLQAAVDAASSGDTIVITGDTPGAVLPHSTLNLPKVLTIQGTGAAVIGAVNPTPALCPNNAFGIALKSGASGSMIRHVTIGANSLNSTAPTWAIFSGGTCLGSAASNITVKQSTILEGFQAISARCAADLVTCPRNWIVDQNEVILSASTASTLIGIVAFDGADGWTIAHNEVTRSCTSTSGDVVGIQSFAFDKDIINTGIKQNKISVQGACTCNAFVAPDGCASAAQVAAYNNKKNDLATVAFNDLRGSDTATAVDAELDPSTTNSGVCSSGSGSDDLTGLHQYAFVSTVGFGDGGGAVRCLTVLGNLDSLVNPNRGSNSASAVRPGKVLPNSP